MPKKDKVHKLFIHMARPTFLFCCRIYNHFVQYSKINFNFLIKLCKFEWKLSVPILYSCEISYNFSIIFQYQCPLFRYNLDITS